MKTNAVVVADEVAHDSLGILQAERSFGTNGVLFEGAVEALEFAIALRVVRGGEDVGGLPEADEFLEVAGDELAAVVTDDLRPGAGEAFPAALEDDLGVGFGHGDAQIPGDDIT